MLDDDSGLYMIPQETLAQQFYVLGEWASVPTHTNVPSNGRRGQTSKRTAMKHWKSSAHNPHEHKQATKGDTLGHRGPDINKQWTGSRKKAERPQLDQWGQRGKAESSLFQLHRLPASLGSRSLFPSSKRQCSIFNLSLALLPPPPPPLFLKIKAFAITLGSPR